MRPKSPAEGARIERRRRVRALLIAVLGAALISDGLTSRSSAPQVAAVATPVMDTTDDRLEAVLHSWNPNLAGPTVTRIAAAVARYSGQYGLEPELVAAVIVVESSVRPWARSPKGAMGLMQVMPHMIYPLGLAGNPATIESNIEAGCWILSHNIRRLGEERGISAYFWGSNIRSLAYLEKVREARENIRRHTS